MQPPLGASLARETVFHLYDQSRKSNPRDMGKYPHEKRYPFIDQFASEMGIDRNQLLVDCILADGLENGVIVRSGWSYMEVGEVDTDTPVVLEHSRLRKSTRERLIFTNERNNRTADSILEHVDEEADWRVKSMQASWRICEVSFEGEFRKGDKRPYSVHPLEATALLYEAIKRAKEKDVEIPQRDVVSLLCALLMHDSVEDWVKGTDHYILDADVKSMSPLMILRVLRRTKLGKYHSLDVAKSTRNMTHLKGQPWNSTYKENIASKVCTDYISAMIKPSGDVLHNFQVDRLEEPKIRKGESESDFLFRLSEYHKKQKILASILFGNGIIDAPNKMNAYRHDARTITFGRPILFAARGLTYRKGDKEKYPYVDWSKAVPLDRFKSEVLPELVENLRNDFQMPKTTLI